MYKFGNHLTSSGVTVNWLRPYFFLEYTQTVWYFSAKNKSKKSILHLSCWYRAKLPGYYGKNIWKSITLEKKSFTFSNGLQTKFKNRLLQASFFEQQMLQQVKKYVAILNYLEKSNNNCISTIFDWGTVVIKSSWKVYWNTECYHFASLKSFYGILIS